ncbi:hypothetical protein AAG570_002691 [Ranatra chinensis]|uniref:Uncharacterized protein n=1 Tax=Ranatra chinensis TaxID=642074 RepID=A0ABD0Y8D3_9HEMI
MFYENKKQETTEIGIVATPRRAGPGGAAGAGAADNDESDLGGGGGRRDGCIHYPSLEPSSQVKETLAPCGERSRPFPVLPSLDRKLIATWSKFVSCQFRLKRESFPIKVLGSGLSDRGDHDCTTWLFPTNFLERWMRRDWSVEQQVPAVLDDGGSLRAMRRGAATDRQLPHRHDWVTRCRIKKQSGTPLRPRHAPSETPPVRAAYSKMSPPRSLPPPVSQYRTALTAPLKPFVIQCFVSSNKKLKKVYPPILEPPEVAVRDVEGAISRTCDERYIRSTEALLLLNLFRFAVVLNLSGNISRGDYLKSSNRNIEGQEEKMTNYTHLLPLSPAWTQSSATVGEP